MEVSDIDLRIHPDSKRPSVMVMLLVYGGDEVEIDAGRRRSKVQAR
jgi:hypothetical protein